MKTLNDYALRLTALLEAQVIPKNIPVTRVTCDSRQVKPGTLFCAIAGRVSDGHDYIKAAIVNGAAGIIHGQDLAEYIPGIAYLKVKQPYLAYSMACELWFGRPGEKLRLHGITGTNGKTTTAFLLEHIFAENGRKTGLITTVECRDGKSIVPSRHTTPDAWELQDLFRRIAANGARDAVMEVSSHGLDQYRPGSAKFRTVVFTNLTGDHLDYHRDMENYFTAKRRLFLDYLAADGTAVINIDDDYGSRLAAALQPGKVVTYGRAKSAACRIVRLLPRPAGSAFDLEFGGKTFRIDSPLIGEYNAANAAAAFSAAAAAGIDREAAAAALSGKIRIPGRLEGFGDARGVSYFVDYAHTDDALRNVLRTLRSIAPARIITVFGCGGNRDRSKRPRMGQAAAEYSDFVVITSDNPRKEDPLGIIAEIKTGLPDNCGFIIEPDREKAIKKASGLARAGDIILVAGKGHETYQDIGGQLFDFDDREIIAAICGSGQK
ncbi:MAG: UDP-N-acetylmuramoyl-L-alanyl-D-glutamate--2,6-diaminopimelate ligase [Victivallaceae bacterium]|nr:UDP-N-acetylmuramoyl-L-alanyl-D-glutamate--2,6-diaminopimelate ligase [Victivallaceae bacterium]